LSVPRVLQTLRRPGLLDDPTNAEFSRRAAARAVLALLATTYL
jgi:hypothetical protein